MPDEMRNSAAWKGQLPYLAGTGQDHESGRAAIILDHMWTVTLPLLQPLADANGFGEPWRTMCRERTAEAAEAARAAAWAAKAAWVAKAARTAARAAAWAAAEAAEAAARAAEAAARAAAWAAAEAAWQTIDPCGLLKRLIAVGGEA
jgi:hypothetical protein